MVKSGTKSDAYFWVWEWISRHLILLLSPRFHPIPHTFHGCLSCLIQRVINRGFRPFHCYKETDNRQQEDCCLIELSSDRDCLRHKSKTQRKADLKSRYQSYESSFSLSKNQGSLKSKQSSFSCGDISKGRKKSLDTEYVTDICLHNSRWIGLQQTDQGCMKCIEINKAG